MLWALNDEQSFHLYPGKSIKCLWLKSRNRETKTSANKKSPQENKKNKKTRPERKKHTKVSINGTAVISPQYLSTLFLLVLPLFLPLFVCQIEKGQKDQKDYYQLPFKRLAALLTRIVWCGRAASKWRGTQKLNSQTVLFSLLLMQSQLLTISSRSGSGGLQGLLELVNFKLDTLLKLLLLLQMLQKC